MQQLKARELQLADVVQLWDGPWGYAVVRQITDAEVKLFRVYGTTADFSYTGGVIPYIGTEECSIELDSDRTVTVWERKPLR